ncbi:MAG: hypothetical protein H7287_04330 [Thermoleophilia bacterium]|nr:hypothetical protein [Thermoleophilia bacterium]
MPRSINDIIADSEALADRFEKYVPTDADRIDVAAFAQLRQAAEGRSITERTIADAVIACRVSGLSWTIIGALLGTSGEAARQRYGSLAAAAISAAAGA